MLIPSEQLVINSKHSINCCNMLSIIVALLPLLCCNSELLSRTANRCKSFANLPDALSANPRPAAVMRHVFANLQCILLFRDAAMVTETVQLHCGGRHYTLRDLDTGTLCKRSSLNLLTRRCHTKAAADALYTHTGQRTLFSCQFMCVRSVR